MPWLICGFGVVTGEPSPTQGGGQGVGDKEIRRGC